MDGITLDALLAEVVPRLRSRHVRKVRLAGRRALSLEFSGEKERVLWLDASREAAGLYFVPRKSPSREPEENAPSDERALLLLRKYLEGARLREVYRIRGERAVVLDASPATLLLRLAGASPSISLAVEGRPLAAIGQATPPWPPPEASPEREWDAVDASAISEASQAPPEQVRRAILAACPSLGRLLAAEIAARPDSFPSLRERLRNPEPILLSSRPLAECDDADLLATRVEWTGVPLLSLGDLVETRAASWAEASALLLDSRLRARAFGERRRSALEGAGQTLRRLVRLETHLTADVSKLPRPDELRRWGETLLSSPGVIPPGASEVVREDPYTSEPLRIPVDPALSAPRNADRLFAQARRAERSRVRIEERIEETRRKILESRREEDRALRARSLADLPGAVQTRRKAKEERQGRRYLTSSGCPILVGRGSEENHRLTFEVARPEDYWLHARDVPGGHVILKDEGGRVGETDLREAAEVAAFFSDAAGNRSVDVHVTRRKHVRPGGSPGRVRVAHSETLRVSPRDPEGRLRRR